MPFMFVVTPHLLGVSCTYTAYGSVHSVTPHLLGVAPLKLETSRGASSFGTFIVTPHLLGVAPLKPDDADACTLWILLLRTF